MNPINYAITDSPLLAAAAAASLPGGAVVRKDKLGFRTFYHAECFPATIGAQERVYVIYTSVSDAANHFAALGKPMLRCPMCGKWGV